MACARRAFLSLAALGMAGAALGAAQRGANMKHVVLLGDSVFDNARYVDGKPDVLARLRSHLAEGWKASLLAVDGAVTRDIAAQVARLSGDASHLVMSIGGNDALMRQNILEQPSRSVGEALALMARLLREFESSYRDAVAAAMQPGLPLTICTIYNGNFPDPAYRERIMAAAALFDDVIIRVATEHRLGVLDLRSICSQPSDYANAIEPSSSGADKIAQAIIRAVGQHDASRPGALILSR
ncbi:SGNH/GDSL hydrolase family protein [Noviherbaspirillum pedocola]|uniref:SGNH/GDSL hydrolase family protein n=1 Tax=Noviherbaspirillum pedocola TaxID=2801341 RepID=A0A934SXW1_9BURK|nr:SGNH/GDSL hydrolase family protein [Noviherbaspirillum pedocola]MBK4737553.1 SGNH/GDSL hydrolase family protein [Noviherbaspirillum pedocola]